MKELDDLANEKRIQIEDARIKRKQVLDGGRVEGNDGSRGLLLTNIEDIKKMKAEQRVHFDKLNALKDKERSLQDEKQSILKNLPKGTRGDQDVAKALKEKQKKYETTSLSNVEEKALLIEID